MLSFILVSTRDAYVFVRSALDLHIISKMKIYMAHQVPVVLIDFGMVHFGTDVTGHSSGAQRLMFGSKRSTDFHRSSHANILSS